MVNFTMLSDIKSRMVLSLPTYIEEADAAKRLIGEARERLSAVARGREMLDFVKEEKYSMNVTDLSDGIIANCSPNDKQINFDKGCDADTVTAAMPHEIFHAWQFATNERLQNFQRFLLGGANKAFRDVSRGRPIRIMHPREISHSTNVIEMAAYAVQTAMVVDMSDNAGDEGVKAAFNRTNPGYVTAYKKVFDHDVFYCGITAKRAVTAPSKGDFFERYDKHRLATALSAYRWFWNAQHSESETPQRHRYADGKIKFLENAVQNKTAAYFKMCAEGYDFEFGSFGPRDIRAVGQGFDFDVFGIPEFDSVDGDTYRAEITAENQGKVAQLNKLLGLQLL